jgi:hypothetical protein
MIKQVTCARVTVERVASAQGIKLSAPNTIDDSDVLVRELSGGREVALMGRTLAGDLFLSLLVAGAL